MKGWLSEQGVEAESLGKKDVEKLITDVDSEVKDALILRQQLAKSSVKKYQAMQTAVCADGRERGDVHVLRCQPVWQMGGAYHPATESSAESHGGSGAGERTFEGWQL
jgi:hypothetical protein